MVVVILIIVAMVVSSINLMKQTEKAEKEFGQKNITVSYTLWNGSTKNQATLVLCYNIPEADKEKIKPNLVTIEDIAQQGLGWHEAVVVKRQFGDRAMYNCAVEVVPRYRDLEITMQLDYSDGGFRIEKTDKILVST